MALTADQKEAQRKNQKVLKDSLEKTVQARDFEALKKENMNQIMKARGEALDAINREGFISLEGRDMELWAAIKEKGEKAASPHQMNSYEDWRACMSALFAELYLLAKGLDLTRQVFVHEVGAFIADGGRYVKDSLKAMTGLGSDIPVEIPKMLGAVSIDPATNIITIEDLKFKRPDSTVPERSANQAFKALISLWLIQNGYTLTHSTSEPGKFTAQDSNKAFLTQAALKQLEQNGNPSLQAVMEVDVSLDKQVTMTPPTA